MYGHDRLQKQMFGLKYSFFIKDQPLRTFSVKHKKKKIYTDGLCLTYHPHQQNHKADMIIPATVLGDMPTRLNHCELRTLRAQYHTSAGLGIGVGREVKRWDLRV